MLSITVSLFSVGAALMVVSPMIVGRSNYSFRAYDGSSGTAEVYERTLSPTTGEGHLEAGA